jgi:hypothetical protein
VSYDAEVTNVFNWDVQNFAVDFFAIGSPSDSFAFN